MIKKIKKFSPLQLGKIGALMYGLLSLLFVPIMIIISLFSPKPGPGIFFVIFIPILYAVMSFIGFIIAAFVYNLCAKWIGGIEIELED